MPASLTPDRKDTSAWDILRRHLRSAVPALYPLEPVSPPWPVSPLSPVLPPWPVLPRWPVTCVVCRGPVRPGFARCYQCGRHGLLGPGLLADAVVPISYAVKGTALAADLWRYKSWLEPSGRARTALLALLLTFLHDHGTCVWRHASLPPGSGVPGSGVPGSGVPGSGVPGSGVPGPGRLAVVPTGCGRPGPHPLLELVSPYLRLPLTRLVIRPGRQGRDLDVNRFRTDQTAAGARVLLIDDSWVSGASAQSAAAALKLAGARQVAIVVLGRHLDPADPVSGPLAARLRPAPYDPAKCAVHTPNSTRLAEPSLKVQISLSG